MAAALILLGAAIAIAGALLLSIPAAMLTFGAIVMLAGWDLLS